MRYCDGTRSGFPEQYPNVKPQVADDRPRIGCAGWALRRDFAEEFPGAGTHLRRYAARFSAVEINSSFYRPHRRSTYERWAASVPDDFRFAVKVPKEATHTKRLTGCAEVLDRFLNECAGLGAKLGPLLVQLPPSLKFSAEVAEAFFAELRERHTGDVACEPRHATWFEADADALFAEHRVARVAADPAVVPAAARPGGWPGFAYLRLHGSPRMYYSAYSDDTLVSLAAEFAEGRGRWCILDNTAEGAATRNALDLLKMVGR